MMKLFVIISAYLLSSQFVLSQDQKTHFPDDIYHYVNGVASDDVLNIRSRPTHKSEILGSFAYDHTVVEVVQLSANKKWGMVNISEGIGWVSMRYLRVQHLVSYGTSKVPVGLFCIDPDAEWSLEAKRSSLELEVAGIVSSEYTIKEYTEARTPHSITMTAGKDLNTLFDFLPSYKGCRTASNNVYPYDVSIWVDGEELGSGCCTRRSEDKVNISTTPKNPLLERTPKAEKKDPNNLKQRRVEHNTKLTDKLMNYATANYFVQLCHDVREGYLQQYITSRQLKEATSAYSKLRTDIGLPDEEIDRIEGVAQSRVDQVGWMMVPENYNAESAKECRQNLYGLRASVTFN